MENRYAIEEIATDAEPMYSEGDTLAVDFGKLAGKLAQLLGRKPTQEELTTAIKTIPTNNLCYL